eukprot:TRINITY_DN1361_c0_g2_i3.p2 TRINITY_DN1361_c0_g2~~TRINITY_DN1361_c0_g2_i3.p2  ORF type:complete len:151 (-),score=31.16 TRINITY_DN1361_c0_g2_i3:44-496(-)
MVDTADTTTTIADKDAGLNADTASSNKSTKTKTPYLVRQFIRSPHWIEVILAYGLVHLSSMYMLFNWLEGTEGDYIIGCALGLVVYTFIEYWFHREILHEWIYKEAHKNHHDHPRRLKIIMTPLLPVQLYDNIIVAAFCLTLGPKWAVML